MNYYIDFDGTLYNTTEFKKDMLKVIAKTCHIQNKKIRYGDVLFELSNALNEQNLDIFNLCKYIANKYQLDENLIIQSVNSILDNGEKYLYDDSIDFLKKLKQQNNKIFLLTYTTLSSFDFQQRKIDGCGQLKSLFDNIYITSCPKYSLNIDYQNGIFIDDNPKELLGLYGTNPIEVIRIKRKLGKYSQRPLGIKIKEITKLSKL